MGLEPKYVLDEMSEFELKALLDNSDLVYDRFSLEMMRLNTFVTARSGGAKVKLTDIAEFPWEQKKTIKHEQVTQVDLTAIRKKAQEYKKYING